MPATESFDALLAESEVVLDRIDALQSDNPTGLQLATTSYHAPSQMIPKETGTLLLARLEGMIVE